MKTSGIICAALVALFASQALAEATPGAGRHDKRVREARYVDGQIYRVNTALMNLTTIEFGNEEIVSVGGGDSEGFLFEAANGGKALFVKPVIQGANTNITVYTSRRAYYLQMVEAGGSPFYVVRFSGGASSTAAPSRGIVRTAPYTNYGANTLNSITPTAVWDDGTFTYFRFNRLATMPAIFRSDGGTERTVNSNTDANGVVRVSGVSAYWVMRAGREETVIKRMRTGQ